MNKGVAGIILTVGAVMLMVLTAGTAAGSLTTRKWRGAGRFTVIRSDNTNIMIESIDSRTKAGIKLVIPGDVEIDTLGQRGQWRPKSMIVLSEKYGQKWMGDSIADYLGIAYTEVWENLGVWDRIAWWGLSGQTEWASVDLSGSSLLESRQLADKQQVLGVSESWNQKARELFYASDLADYDVEIRVWNTTDFPGLAGKAAAVLESAGLRVIQVGQAEIEAGYCLIRYGAGADQEDLVKWISQTLGCRPQKTAEDSNFMDVYLDQEYAKRYINE